MAFSFLPFVQTPEPARPGAESLHRALQNVQVNRQRRAQLELQRQQMEQQKALAEQAAAAKLARQGIEDQQWASEQQFDAQKQADLQGYRADQLRGGEETRRLNRQKAEADFRARVRQSVEAGATDEELLGFLPEARALGIDLGASAGPQPQPQQPAAQLQLPDYAQGQDPEEFARMLSSEVGKAVGEAQAAQQPAEPSPPPKVSALLPDVPLGAIRQQQSQRVTGPLGALAQASRPQDRPAFQMAEKVAPFLPGTPMQRVQLAAKLGQAQAQRQQSQINAARAAAATSERFGAGQETQATKRYVKLWEGRLKKLKVDEHMDALKYIHGSMDTLKEARKLKAEGRTEEAGTLFANLLYGLARARDPKGRLSDRDVKVGAGLESAMASAESWVSEFASGGWSDRRIRMVERALLTGVKTVDKRLRRDYGAMEKLRDQLGKKATRFEDAEFRGMTRDTLNDLLVNSFSGNAWLEARQSTYKPFEAGGASGKGSASGSRSTRVSVSGALANEEANDLDGLLKKVTPGGS